ncbi:hypothetical protein ACJMK2_003857 [Sinanodonta woodiana]|uniref:Uncharacterized protein n=1 Tax=Sinanodonta woodiana TaxID=1069815 RepID=A0ABD3XZF0_SINWO
MIELRPSEIRYSQATISTVFDTKSKHSKKPIEDTLVEICEGRQKVSNIPSITVCKYKDQWYTVDNRRLWVFKHLEALDKCTSIFVNETERSKIDDRKFSTCNEGISVGFRAPFAPEPSGNWYIKAKNAMIEKLALLSSKFCKEADTPVCELKTETSSESNPIVSPACELRIDTGSESNPIVYTVCELETDTSSESDPIISNSKDSDVDINSDSESSNININGVGIPKIQEDSTIKILSPNNGDHSSLDPLDKCNDNADRKDPMKGKLQSDDVSTSNDTEPGKMYFPLDEPSPSTEVDRDNNSNHNTTSSSQREDHIINQRSDQVNHPDQDHLQNDEELVSHTQKPIQDQNFNQQLKLSTKRQIQDEEEIIGSGGNENSPKRSRADV